MITPDSVIDFDGVYVCRRNGKTEFGYRTPVQKMRCEFLCELEESKGKESFEIRQKPVFRTVGPMLDMSRGGVMTVEAVCEYIKKCAMLGMNMLMLYTEDVYAMEKYPKFGYMRGRYSLDELRRIDDYADSLGVEVIPCIQTLGHLAAYLRWGEVPAEDVSVLLVEDERTYAFIEEEIKTMKAAFRSKRIHIGMDEAAGLGRGNYLNHHSYEEREVLFNRHLGKVLELTKKYGYDPMIWSDMLYGDEYYTDGYEIPQKTLDSVPQDVTLVFWDYYHDYYGYYDGKLRQQERVKNTSAFAGAVWSWDGHLPYFEYSYKTMAPALQAAIDHNVQTIIATEWGNDGVECDFRRLIPSLAIFSEYMYRGKDCTKEEILEVAEAIGGMPREVILAESEFYLGENGAVRPGKAMIYCDLLKDTVCRQIDYPDMIERYTKAAAVIDAHPELPDYAYDHAAFHAALTKAKLMNTLRAAYKAGDRSVLLRAAEEMIPALQGYLDDLYAAFTARWESGYKPFGFETHCQRFGGMNYRLTYVAKRLREYALGKVQSIPEFEEEINPSIRVTWRHADFYMNL